MITAPAAGSLDYDGLRPPLRPELRQLWQVPVPFKPGHTRLHSWQGQALLALVGERLALVGKRPEVEAWPGWNVELVSARPGWRSDPVAIARDGNVYACRAGGDLRLLAETGEPGANLSAIGLPQGRCLLQHYPEGEPWFELRDVARGWRRQGSGSRLLPHEDWLLWGRDDGLQGLRLDTGETVWTATGAYRAFLGVVDEHLWAVAGENVLTALKISTGQVVHAITPRLNRAVEGVLDERGLYHTTTGLRYQIYDLVNARLIADHQLPDATTASGNLACIAEDGRLVFFDDRGRLCLFDPQDPAALVQLHAARGMGRVSIAGGMLYALAGDLLLCFG